MGVLYQKPLIPLFLLSFLFFAEQGRGQPFGNEWIEYGQQYYRIPITEDGIHRIDRSALQQAGVPVASIDPRNFQVFGREKEQYIHVKGEGDGSFDPGDHIEFYAEGNDGWLDSLLYHDPTSSNHPSIPSGMADPHYSLYNDTVHYFLTWNSSTNNRRMAVSNDSAYSSYPSVDYVWHTGLISLTDRYARGQRGPFDPYPQFTEGEGWVGPLFNKGQSDPRDLSSFNPYQGTGAPDAELTAVSVSASSASLNSQGFNHHLQLRYGPGTGNLLVDTLYKGYQLNRLEASIPNGDIGDPFTRIIHRSVDDLGVASDYHSVSYIELSYPFAGDLDGRGRFSFEVESTGASKLHVPFTNISGSGARAYVLDGQVQRLPVVRSGNDADLLVPMNGSGDRRRCFITDLDSVHQVSELEPVRGNGYFQDLSQMDPDSAFLIITHSSLMSEAQDYGNFRESLHPNMDAVLVDVAELYPQFGGGIPKHALAIRRFCAFVLQEWSEPPKAVFLVGKSVREASQGSPGSRKSASAYASNLVPSFGEPSSDLLLTAGLDGASVVVPRIPVGRLSARNGDDVSAYLQKMQQYEDRKTPYNQRTAWMKRVLHFGGGNSKPQQDQFKGYLQGYENIIDKPHFGGNVHTFLKTSSSPIQLNVKDSLKKLIDQGTALMTFFGHGSGSGFDQSIDEPQNYNNQGKYPLLIANSCYSGDIHRPNGFSTSEKFVLAQQRGMIGFIASVKQGVTTYLNTYTTQLYQAIAKERYHAPVGEQMKYAIENYGGSEVLYSRNITCLGMTLHGDPMMSLYSHERPEYVVTPSDLVFEPSDITPQLDSFDVKLSVTNIGRATTDSFDVTLRRSFPDQSQEEYSKPMSDLYFRDTISFTLPVEGFRSNGVNRFDAFVDLPGDWVYELFDDVNNNKLEGRDLLVRTGDVFPVEPFEYAIIPEDSVTLRASTGDPFASPQDVHFQIDTTDLFNSPLLRTTDIHQSGGVLDWRPPLQLEDSTVYFWRVSPDSNSTDDGAPSWRESSFQYIPGERGWGQSHFFQFKKDGFKNIVYDRPDREFEFFQGKRTIDCTVYGDASNSSAINGTKWKLDLNMQDYGGCGLAPAIHVAVVDPTEAEVWGTYGEAPSGGMVNADKQFGNINNGTGCRDRVEKYFIFRQGDATQMQDLENMLVNEVPDGHYVLIYTWQYVSYDDWNANNPNLAPLLQSWGSDSIGAAQDSVPFIFLTQKGSPDSAVEVYGNSKNDQISLSKEITIDASSGRIVSELAGPAYEWDALYWRGSPQESPSEDSSRIELVGVRHDGSEQLLSSFHGDLDSVPDLENYADASEFPYLRLEAYLEDTNDITPEQLHRWQLLHRPAPEAAVDPSLGYLFHSDTVQEGENVRMGVPIRNISAFDMDSLLVGYWFQDENGLREPQEYRRLAPLPAGDTLVDTAAYSSLDHPGENAFLMEINPVDTSTGRFDQIEQYHFNNIARRSFYTMGDRINPILDVTFDGRHIMDGDIVSSEPEILITLDDENEFLLLDEDADTSNFEIFLSDPGGEMQKIPFQNSNPRHELNWIPADSKENTFTIEYLPRFEKDGEYELMVQGQDKSGNASGDLRYRISFEVVTETSVSNVINYPNPFSTRTQFVFTLTGNKVPDRFKIRIMTVTGKVVREIGKDELGPLRIGKNRTDFWWDGTDEFGDRLANGVYLYQVIVKENGEKVEHRETSLDPYFKKGFGKMYLMR